MRGGPENQHPQVLLDLVKAVLDACFHEYEAAGPHLPVLVRDADRSMPTDHVVDLVLSVRLLPVDHAARPDGKADAELVGRQEIDVSVAV